MRGAPGRIARAWTSVARFGGEHRNAGVPTWGAGVFVPRCSVPVLVRGRCNLTGVDLVVATLKVPGKRASGAPGGLR